MTQRAIGKVARIRLNPTDCMGVIDVVAHIGLDPKVYSFDQVTRLALSSLLEAVRQHNIIPTRDGFEYGDMMRPFETRSVVSQARKMEITTFVNRSAVQIAPVIELSPELKRKKVRWLELATKKEADELNWSAAEDEELMTLTRELNPL